MSFTLEIGWVFPFLFISGAVIFGNFVGHVIISTFDRIFYP